MDYRNWAYEHWPRYEDITDEYYPHGRFFYGEDQGGRLRTGRVVAFYREFNGVTASVVEPVVRFLGPDGVEGRPEYVSLGGTEKYWMCRTVEDVEHAWHRASSTGSWPRPHGGKEAHPAAPCLVDPAHYLLFYAALLDGRKLLGRCVGWDPPAFNDELPTPIVRLYGADGSLDERILYVGLNLPYSYALLRSLDSARQRLALWAA